MPNHQPRPGAQDEPRPPFPAKKLAKPGIEAELEPKPRFEANDYRPAGKLKGKKALITGGDSGIGRAVALIYAREGADVVINYLPEEQQNAQFCRELVERTVDELGGIDILVSNAAHQNRKNLDELTPQEIERTFAVNVYAYMYLTQAAVPAAVDRQRHSRQRRQSWPGVDAAQSRR